MSQSSTPLTLAASTRSDMGRNHSSNQRAMRQVPAVIYGHNIPTRHLSVDLNTVEKVYAASGESSLVDLVIDQDAAIPVVIHAVQHDALSHRISHLDFYQVKMNETMQAEVELLFEGVAPAVKGLGGVLVKSIDHITVSCLPKDLPHDMVVDISLLKTFDDTIHVSDLPTLPGVEFLVEPDAVIASVVAPRTTAELEALNEAVVEDVAAVEVAAKKEEPAEEAAAPEKK